LNKKLYISLSLLLASGCTQTNDVPVTAALNQQLSGIWTSSNSSTGNIRFYSDESAKITLPQRTPPIKLISPYSGIKENTIGIALGGFWSGPLLIDTSDIENNIINVRFPDEEPVLFHKLNSK